MRILLIAMLLIGFGTWIRFQNLFHRGFVFDTGIFYEWGSQALDMGFMNFWRDYQEWLDYLPGAIYVLMGLVSIGRIWADNHEAFVIVLKTMNWMFDIGMVLMIYYISQNYTKLPRLQSLLWAAGVYALPAFWFNSGVWGQMDGMIVTLGVCGILLYFQAVKHSERSWWRSYAFWSGVVLAIAFWIKLQVVLFLPILVLAHLSVRNYKVLLHQVIGFLTTSVLIALPAFMANALRLGGNLVAPFYRDDMISRGAASIWTLIGLDQKITDPLITINDQSFISIGTLAMLIYAVFMLIFFLNYYSVKVNLQLLKQHLSDLIRRFFPRGMKITEYFYLTFVLTFAYFIFMPRMYARYLYPAAITVWVFTVGFAGTRARRGLILLGIGLNLSFWLNMMDVYTFWGYDQPEWVMQSVNAFTGSVDHLSALLNLIWFGILIWQMKEIKQSLQTDD